MARRKPGREWTAAGLPGLRDRLVGEHVAAQRRIPRAADLGRIQAAQAQAMVADLASQTQTLEFAPMYWVSDRMAEVAVSAADSLPEWTPELAMPAPTGFLAWGSPAGQVRYTVPGATRTHTDIGVDWDAMWWRTYQGSLRIALASRLVGHRDTLSAGWKNTPLMATCEIVIADPSQARTSGEHITDEVDGDGDGRLLSVVASAWLLMGQHRIADTRIQRADTGRSSPVGERPLAVRDVTIIDLRRADPKPADYDPEHPGREYSSRFWVDGHWRQQACGPGHSQRKPVWISPYIKGPEDLPVSEKPRVHVWRR